jgi:hypothetical protein
MTSALTREQLFALFKADAHGGLESALQRPDVAGLAVYEGDDGRAATPAVNAKPPTIDRKGRQLVGVFLKVQEANQRTRAALDYMDANPGATGYQAAKLYNVTPTAVYAAIRRRAKRAGMKVCPCCGQVLPKPV